jgi:hypothetical protein
MEQFHKLSGANYSDEEQTEIKMGVFIFGTI